MAQTTWTSITNRCVTVLQGITDIGNVYNRLRLFLRGADVRTLGLFTTSGGADVFRTWMVMAGPIGTKWAESSGTVEMTQSVVLEGFFEYDDGGSSELTANDLAKAAMRALAADARATKLGGTVLFAMPPKLEVSEPRMFGPVVCHYVKVVMPVTTIEQ